MANSQDKHTARRRLGDIGEDIACKFLVKRGFKIVERNYLRKWGEIDIVARKDGVARFIEVKSVSHGTRQGEGLAVRPEENMHSRKIGRLIRTIETYLLHKKLDCEWQLDLVTVKIDMRDRMARVELIENIGS